MKKKLSMAFAGTMLAASSALAQPSGFKGYQDADTKLSGVTKGLASVVAPIFNIASAVLGLIFVIYLIWNISQQQKGNTQAQDALMKVGGGLLGAVLLLQVIRILFFN